VIYSRRAIIKIGFVTIVYSADLYRAAHPFNGMLVAVTLRIFETLKNFSEQK
jgi:hypothetical protein